MTLLGTPRALPPVYRLRSSRGVPGSGSSVPAYTAQTTTTLCLYSRDAPPYFWRSYYWRCIASSWLAPSTRESVSFALLRRLYHRTELSCSVPSSHWQGVTYFEISSPSLSSSRKLSGLWADGKCIHRYRSKVAGTETTCFDVTQYIRTKVSLGLGKTTTVAIVPIFMLIPTLPWPYGPLARCMQPKDFSTATTPWNFSPSQTLAVRNPLQIRGRTSGKADNLPRHSRYWFRSHLPLTQPHSGT